jgi:hypothetical protein
MNAAMALSGRSSSEEHGGMRQRRRGRLREHVGEDLLDAAADSQA